MKKSTQKDILGKIASKKVLDANKVAIKSVNAYKKTSSIIDKANIAMGKKATFTSNECSTLHTNIDSHGITSTQNIQNNSRLA